MALSVRGQQQIRLDVGAEAQVRVGSKVRLAAWQDPKNRGAAATKRSPAAVEKSEDGQSVSWGLTTWGCYEGALLSKNDVGIVTEEMPPGSPEPLKVKGPSGRAGPSWARGCP